MAYGPAIKKNSKKPLLIGIAIVGLLVVVGVGYFWMMNDTQDPVAATSPQTNVEDVSIGIQDNQTATPSPIQTPPGQTPAAESTTAIVITSPSSGGTVKAGTKLEGTAPSVRTVSYRIQSDDRGLVGQGDLAVVNNKFSGTLAATGVAGSGFVEVFVVDTQGREQKHAKVEVSFQ